MIRFAVCGVVGVGGTTFQWAVYTAWWSLGAIQCDGALRLLSGRGLRSGSVRPQERVFVEYLYVGPLGRVLSE